MSEREQFEAWFEADTVPSSTGFFERDPNNADEYNIFEVQCEWRAWQASRRAAIEEAIAAVEAYQVPVGNSAAGEMACEWTMDALKEVRDAIRALSKTAKEE